MQHAALTWADFCWFADFGAHRRLLHVSGALCPLLLAASGSSWAWHHTPLVLGDVASGVLLMPVALLALRRRGVG